MGSWGRRGESLGLLQASQGSMWLAWLHNKTLPQNKRLTEGEVNELKYDSTSTKKTFIILISKGSTFCYCYLDRQRNDGEWQNETNVQVPSATLSKWRSQASFCTDLNRHWKIHHSRVNTKRSVACRRLDDQTLTGVVLDSVGLANQAILVSVQYWDFEVPPAKGSFIEGAIPT